LDGSDCRLALQQNTHCTILTQVGAIAMLIVDACDNAHLVKLLVAVVHCRLWLQFVFANFVHLLLLLSSRSTVFTDKITVWLLNSRLAAK
jgi:hypothetical protein